MKQPVLATVLIASFALSACAPTQQPPVASAPPPSTGGDRIISGPAPVPSPSSMPGSPPNYVLTGQDPVPNLPDAGSIQRPDSSPYGRW